MAALAFAGRGLPVKVVERADVLEEIGAGLQLSPNATRILARLGILEGVSAHAVAPEAIVLRDALSLRVLARIALGAAAERRWGAPYLVAHRADLQQALLAAVAQEEGIELVTGAQVHGMRTGELALCTGDAARPLVTRGRLIVGADGVHSAVRTATGLGQSRFSGLVAWRMSVSAGRLGKGALLVDDAVTTFLSGAIHLVAYRLRKGSLVNLVAVTRGHMPHGAGLEERALLERALDGLHPQLAQLGAWADWTPWPLHLVRASHWTQPEGVALIGDAAHAMTPFAAQGAAMAIEDAAVLADLVARTPGDMPRALARFEAQRLPRVRRVARRGQLNRLAWHARGPAAVARNMVLGLRGGERLARDLDWLYGWEMPDPI